MNLAQSMFAMVALTILSLTILRLNNNIFTTDEMVMDSKIGILATSIGTSLIEKESNIAFDENTKNNSVKNVNDLTPVSLLGQESSGVFDDSDTFKNYLQDDTIYMIPFHTICKVTYINPTNPNGSSSSRTWHKKLTIKIANDFSKDTLELSAVYS